MLFSFNFAAGHEQTIVKFKKSSKKSGKGVDNGSVEMQKIETEKPVIKNEQVLSALSKRDQKRISKLVDSSTVGKARNPQEPGAKKAQSLMVPVTEENEKMDNKNEPQIPMKDRRKSALMAMPSTIQSEVLVDDDDLEVEVIPAYHEEDLIEAKEKIGKKTYFKFLFSSKGWLYFAYVQCFCFSTIGVILPFFYAGNMTTSNQVYWMVDVVITLVLGALIYQPLQNAFLSLFRAVFNSNPKNFQKSDSKSDKSLELKV